MSKSAAAIGTKNRLIEPGERACGGGLDFAHGMLLYGDLVRMGKRVTIGSYSFGQVDTRPRFRSAATGFIMLVVAGLWGGDTVPPALDRKLTSEDRFFVWPLMSMVFAFDVEAVAQRSRLVGWLAEELPSNAAMAGQFGIDFTNLEVIDRGQQPEADLEELPEE